MLGCDIAEHAKGAAQHFSDAPFGHDRVEDVGAIRRGSGIPHRVPFGEEGVIHAAADVRKGIDEQASRHHKPSTRMIAS